MSIAGPDATSGDGHREGADLVVVSLPGVQRFIQEARSTADVSAASGIYSVLAQAVVESLRAERGGELVLPATDSGVEGRGSGMPNRVVALLPGGTGADAGARAVKAARDSWESWLRKLLRLADGAPVPGTPGFPLVQWVCVPADGLYEEQWRQAQRLLAARRRVRDFAAIPADGWRQRALCSLAPRWPAEDTAPPGVPRHDKDTALSLTGWAKRRWAYLNGEDGFPSTASVASAPYRRAILEQLGHDDDVRKALAALARAASEIETTPEVPVPGLEDLIPDSGPGRWLGRRGGPWVYPDHWQPAGLARELGLRARGPKAAPREELARIAQAADAGRKAAACLRKVMEKRGVPLSDYLAVVVQDIDSMGRFLSGAAPDARGGKIKVVPNGHRRLSGVLLDVAAAQRAALRSPELLSVPVYAGGDDLLAFTPAARALGAARACQQASSALLPTASTAVLYFHYHASIQRAMSEARGLLGVAKDRVPDKHALAVGYLRRSGASAASVQRWDGPGDEDTAGLFRIFARGQKNTLSPRLVTDLERDAGELRALARASERLYLAELARLVGRHEKGGADRGVSEQVAGALQWLGEHEYADDVPGPHAAARVGVFLRQEAR